MSRRTLTERQAVEHMSRLVVATTGWNDDTVDGTVDMMTRQWHDDAAAAEAISEVIQSWSEMSRPPWAVLSKAYRNAIQRRAMDVPALPQSSWGAIPFDQGMKIAYQSYCKEVRRQERVPKPFSEFLTLVPRAVG
jgi:hypothetical protein